MKFVITLLMALSGVIPVASPAQNVWRCGPDGRTFTDAPCPQGQAIDMPASRPAEDLHSAQQRAARERAWADQLQRERVQREAQPNAGPTGIYGLRPVKPLPAPKVKTAKKKLKLPAEGADTWTAVGPSTRRKKG
jgi:hypothetical protein